MRRALIGQGYGVVGAPCQRAPGCVSLRRGALVLGLAAFALLVSLPVPAAESSPDLTEIGGRLDALDGRARQLGEHVDYLVEQYGRDIGLTIGEFERRFSEAEIQFLLENYAAAIVHLYDVVETPDFEHLDRYDDALYYLAESLYRQESWLPARGFFLRLVERGPTRHDSDAVLRLIEISGRVGDYSNVEEHYQRVVASGRPVRPEVRYVWGKFIFGRDDLDDEERWARARDVFAEIPIDGPYGLAARYHMGAVMVQEARTTLERARVTHRANPEALESAEKHFERDLERSLSAFLDVVTAAPRDRRCRAIQEQGWLALGRVYMELGRIGEAIDSYQRVHRHSDYYYQSLYEVAWAFVRDGDLDNARRAAEILLTGAGGSALAPEIRLLLGQLHARAQRYDRAVAAYDDVIVEYAPVRDDLDALLDVEGDPIQYFSGVIAAAGGSFDVEEILPPAAARWASTQEDVERGFSIATDLAAGRNEIDEGREIATRILASLDAGTLEPFPALAEGHRYASETQADMLKVHSELSEIEHLLLSHRVPPSLQATYEEAREAREKAETRYRALPATPEQMEERRQRWLGTVERVRREAFRARMEAQSQAAQIVAMRRLIRDRREELVAEPGALDAFMARLDREKAEVERLEARANLLMRELDRLSDAVRADTAVAGAREAVRDYEEALREERALFARVRQAVGASDAELVRLDQTTREMVGGLERLSGLIDDIERRGAVRREVLRDQVMNELARLDEYESDVAAIDLNTRGLVGRLAYDSVRAVRRQFYDLVLRSDVGIIDVAWARKTDRSREIQELVEDKDKELRSLERSFREVMHDPDAEVGR